jgi:hypothetical protein
VLDVLSGSPRCCVTLHSVAQGELLQHVSASVALVVDAALASIASCGRHFATPVAQLPDLRESLTCMFRQDVQLILLCTPRERPTGRDNRRLVQERVQRRNYVEAGNAASVIRGVRHSQSDGRCPRSPPSHGEGCWRRSMPPAGIYVRRLRQPRKALCPCVTATFALLGLPFQ